MGKYLVEDVKHQSNECQPTANGSHVMDVHLAIDLDEYSKDRRFSNDDSESGRLYIQATTYALLSR